MPAKARRSAYTAVAMLFLIAGVGLRAQDASRVGGVELHLRRARLEMTRQRYNRAEEELRRAESLSGKTPETFLMLAEVYRYYGERETATGYVKEALRLQPDSCQAHYALARLHFEVGDLKTSRREIETALRVDRRFAPALALKGDLAVATGRYDKAIEAYEASLGAASDFADMEGVSERAEALRLLEAFEAEQRSFDVRLPKLLTRPHLTYNPLARRLGIAGTVHLAVLVDENGEAADVLLLSRLGSGLDERAAEAARTIKFAPATRGREPVAFWLRIQIEFQLKQAENR